MPMKYVKTQSLPRMDDPKLNRALAQIDEELNKIARVQIDWTDSTQDFITTGTLGSGKLTVNSGVGQSIIIKGTSTGDANLGWIGFYDSDGTTRRGHIGDGSSGNDDIYIGADTGYLRLLAAGYISLGTHTYFPDDVVMSFGASLDYSIGYANATDTLQIVNGTTLGSNVRLKLDSSGHFDFGAGNLTTTGNVGIGISGWGESAAKVLGIGGSTAPTTSPANMVQMWSEDIMAGHAQLHYRAEGGLARPLGDLYDVRDWGMIPNDNTGTVPADNVTAWNTIIADATAGDKIYIPKGVWYINDELAASQEVTIYGNGVGSEIHQETDAKYGFNITVDNVTVRNLRLYGYSAPSANVSGADAIHIAGTAGDPPTNLVNVNVIDCFIENWGMYAIYANYLDNFEFSRNYIKSITYAGIMGISIQDGVIDRNRIDDIKCDSGTSNGYGISLTRSANVSLTEFPRSARVEIVNNNVKNVLLWDGISTHAAEDCQFNCNVVKSTKRGINAVSDGVYGPVNNQLCYNTVNQGDAIDDIDNVDPADDHPMGAGVGMAGVTDGELATGCVIGNIVIGHGTDDDTSGPISGGLSLKYTQGVPVTGNRLTGPCSRGIMLYQHNYDFTASGNTISDVWSAKRNVIAIMTNSINNIGYIGENSWANVTRDSDYYLGSGTSYGIYISDKDGTAISLGNNHSEDADTYIRDTGSKAITHTMVTGLTIAGTFDVTGQIDQRRAATSCRSHIMTYATDPDVASALYLRTSDSDTLKTFNATEDGDRLGTIFFQGVRSANDLFTQGALIRATQNGAAGTRLPTDLELATYTDSGINADQLLLGTGGNIFMNDSANAKNTKGLTINQGATDDEILAFKSSDVAQGCTDEAEADTYGSLKKLVHDEGGVRLSGYTSILRAVMLEGIVATENTGKNASALAPIVLKASKLVGGETYAGSMTANANLFVIQNHAENATRFIVDADGDILFDGSHSAYQDHDDIGLLAELEVQLDKSKKLKSSNKYKKKDLEDLKILRPFLSTKATNMLLFGAIRQLNERVKALEN